MTRHAVTGALGFSGRHLTARLLEQGDDVVNLTNHPDRPDPFTGRVSAEPLGFDRPQQLAAALDGVDTLFNTYWVRFPRGGLTHAVAVRNSIILIEAARAAGVRRIVHVSIANASPTSRLSYYRGKAQVEAALARSGVSHAVLRPTVLFGDEPILPNSIAWLLRRLPIFGIPGDGRYGVQPLHVDDLVALALEAAAREDDVICDAVGPEIYSFEELVVAIRDAVGSSSRLVQMPSPLALLAAGALGRTVGDVLLTREELEGLMDGLLVSTELPRGEHRFSDWLRDNGHWLGRAYLSEVARHFPVAATRS